jgi:hypothetical protein
MPKKRESQAWKAYVKTGAAWAKPNYVKEEEDIEEDTAVASVSTKDTPKEQPESKNQKKKENNKELMEPGTIKGGKTEVDVNPTTDNRDDDGKKIDDEGKKATKAANAKAGVKEETMNTSKNFGLPADLVKTVEEALKGNQHKIDANKNNKIDAQDFKLLKSKKKVEEEVETVDEAVNHREFGSKGKMHPTMAKGMKVGQHADFYGHGNGDKHYGMVTKNTGTAVHIKAAGKTHKFSVSHNVSEEVEELDELAPATMKSYQSKAVDSIGHAAQSARSMGSDKDHLKKPLGNEIRKRKKGLDLANERLAKKDMDEETDPGFTAEELARIEEIAKGL